MNPHILLSADEPVCDFPRLHYLKIRNASSFIIFSKIRSPSLSTLQINTSLSKHRVYYHHDAITVQQRLWTTFPQLIDFLQESGSSIREFHLRCWFLQDNEALRRLLGSLSSVHRLCLDTWFTDESESICDNVGDDRAQAQNSQALLPFIRKICMHSPDVDPYGTESGPMIRKSSYWRSFSAFLHSRNLTSESKTSDSAPGAITESNGLDASFMDVNNTDRPNLLVCLPDKVKAVFDETQRKPFESIRELDGISITIQAQRTCEYDTVW
ncbi:hypothetical protein H1R20_g9708, partial [Candolleomyces eurysporus]